MLHQLCKFRNQQFELMKRCLCFAYRSLDAFAEIKHSKMEFRFAGLKIVSFISAIVFVEAIEYHKGRHNISSIPPEEIPGDPILKIVNIPIKRIHKGAFITYKNLIDLQIFDNKLGHIEEGAFDGQDKLKIFFSFYNWLVQLPTDLGPPTNSLEFINWWQSPPSLLHFPYFAAFKNLTRLNIGAWYTPALQLNRLPQSMLYINIIGMRLPVFPKFVSFTPMIEEMHVSRCNMHSMSIENVTGLTEVNYLNVRTNKLAHFPNISFMSKLESLFLQENKLLGIPDLFHLPLQNLRLADNPLVCDKALCWIRMWQWMKSPETILRDDPVCASPVDVSGMKLLDVDPTFMECFRGKYHGYLCVMTPQINKTRLFVKQLIRFNGKEPSKLRILALGVENPQWIPIREDQQCRKRFKSSMSSWWYVNEWLYHLLA